MKYLISSFILVVMTACSLQTTVPYATKYMFNEVNITKKTDQTIHDITLKISIPQSANYLLEEKMFYQKGDQTQASFSMSRWALSPAQQVSHLFESALIQSGLFKTVLSYQSNIDGDIALEINIIELMHYFSADEKNSYVKVGINLTLIDQVHRKVIDSAYFSSREDALSADAKGGVEAYNKALRNILDKAVVWIRQSTQKYVSHQP